MKKQTSSLENVSIQIDRNIAELGERLDMLNELCQWDLTGEINPAIKRYREEFRRFERTIQMLTNAKANIDTIRNQATTLMTNLKTLLTL